MAVESDVTMQHTPGQKESVRFYDGDAALARIVADFLCDGFKLGSPGIVVATANQRREIARELAERAVDVAALERARDLRLFDAEAVVATFLVEGKVDPEQFAARMSRIVEDVRRDRPNCRVRLFGQMADVLWQKGERSAAIRLELLWNQWAQTAATDVECGYAMGSFFKDAKFAALSGSSADGAHDSDAGNATAAADSTRRKPRRRDRR